MGSNKRTIERRGFLKGTLGATSLVALSGCDNLTQSSWFPSILSKAEKLTEAVQRAVTPRDALAKEYSPADISKIFPANGNTDPGTEAYAEHLAQNFFEWTVEVVGLVKTPRSWSLAALKELPSRTQITRHDCVEGWSAIGKWTGIPLGDLIRMVEPLPNVRYAVFHCADVDDEGSLTTRAWRWPIAIIRRPCWPMSSMTCRWIFHTVPLSGSASSGSWGTNRRSMS
jgi:DMSO/TMAO reductase YedYZ molybdopterin-dependent catalytic subunit